MCGVDSADAGHIRDGTGLSPRVRGRSALVACAIVAKIARDIRATKNIIAARTKNTQQVEDEDRKLVRYGKRLGGHYIAWPREWCNQEEAAGRGAMTVNELWPDETAEPIAHRRFTWVQRTRRM